MAAPSQLGYDFRLCDVLRTEESSQSSLANFVWPNLKKLPLIMPYLVLKQVLIFTECHHTCAKQGRELGVLPKVNAGSPFRLDAANKAKQS